MIFFKQQLIPSKQIYYIESSAIYLHTFLTTVKLSIKRNLYCFINSNLFSYKLYISLFNFIKLNNAQKKINNIQSKIHYVGSFMNYLLHNSLVGSVGRFRLIGRGYKAFPFIYTYMFKLGYSHLIFFSVPLTIRLKKKVKKHRFFRFIGIWSHQTHLYLSKIKSLRIPDVYSAKGIFKKEQFFMKKEGKKAFTL